MQRTLLAAGIFFTAVFSSGQSHAQQFFDSGEVSVAIERAFGFHYAHRSIDPPGPGEFDFNGTAFGLGWYGEISPYHATRAAVDVFVIDQLSIGGSIAFFAQSGDPDDNAVLFAPRVGYAIPLSSLFTFWPRGGFTFIDFEDDSMFALSGEAAFVLTPQPTWGIILAPTLDIGVFGDFGVDDTDYFELALGIPAVGILGNF